MELTRNTPIIVDVMDVGHAVGDDKRPACGVPGPPVPDDVLDLFIAEWHLQSHPQYRMPPASACPGCFPDAASRCAGVNVVDGHVICRGCGIDLGEWPGGEEIGWNPGGYCAFGCVPEMQEDEPTADEIADYDLAARLADPCPECGAASACGYDDEGRPMIHALQVSPSGE